MGPNVDWETHLRKGIRGGTVKEIVGILEQTLGKPVLLEPDRLGIKIVLTSGSKDLVPAEYHIQEGLLMAYSKFSGVLPGLNWFRTCH